MSRFDNTTLPQTVPASDAHAAATNLFRAVIQLPEKTIAVFYKWQTRLDNRKQLAGLADWQLQDIGLTRNAANAEARKPVWIP